MIWLLAQIYFPILLLTSTDIESNTYDINVIMHLIV